MDLQDINRVPHAKSRRTARIVPTVRRIRARRVPWTAIDFFSLLHSARKVPSGLRRPLSTAGVAVRSPRTHVKSRRLTVQPWRRAAPIAKKYVNT